MRPRQLKSEQHRVTYTTLKLNTQNFASQILAILSKLIIQSFTKCSSDLQNVSSVVCGKYQPNLSPTDYLQRYSLQNNFCLHFGIFALVSRAIECILYHTIMTTSTSPKFGLANFEC